MAHWPEARHPRAMGHYRRADIPFQFALAEAFTICDACHCAVQTATNTNRLFLWSGTNDPVIGSLETRFGIHEPNIAPWRRAICGDLTSAFDFAAKDVATPPLPDPGADARRAAALTGQVSPDGPAIPAAPWQEPGVRRARTLPYRLEVSERPLADGLALLRRQRRRRGVPCL